MGCALDLNNREAAQYELRYDDSELDGTFFFFFFFKKKKKKKKKLRGLG